MARMDQTINSNIQKSSPAWLAGFIDPMESVAHFPAKIDPTLFEDIQSVKVHVTTAALAAATTIVVTALTGGIPDEYVIDLGGGKFARVDGAVAAGATSITVDALPTALAGGENGYYRPRVIKNIPSGTWISRTTAQRLAGTPFHPAIYTEDEFGLILYDIEDATGLIPGSGGNDVVMIQPAPDVTIKENYLPEWTAGRNISGTSADLAKLRGLFHCITGWE